MFIHLSPHCGPQQVNNNDIDPEIVIIIDISKYGQCRLLRYYRVGDGQGCQPKYHCHRPGVGQPRWGSVDCILLLVWSGGTYSRLQNTQTTS